ncbi:hypothetical protein B0T14DRAFT_506526 [Immersiella caudata]|uniref:DNA mismatch repair protein S5 domain-containing protein n=1 Tax=Immersiella caudata TaxID=314043 RepID=A0AA40CCP7_9PEZI|nr:hypothetical protein B0T14DRAFT_506526 [Immersiella caudata]
MSILPLPEEDTRKLGATLSIATPAVLVKELLDNALDAGATTVVVFISPNAVDHIEVRDNGHGIHPSDFDALGRSGYTSKLKSICELANIGPSSLGFRGVALASITTASEVTVTTRTSGEPVAEVFRLVNGGGIQREGLKGSPIGTAVCVNNLFAGFPVRQRSAIRDASKAISKIKELLKSYAFARHQTKLAFRVLGKPESTWCYTGNAGSCVREVANQLFGQEVASHCDPVAYSSLGRNNEEGSQGGEAKLPLSFEGLLPHPGLGGDSQKLIGAFFSVDSRPIMLTRGLGRKLLSNFRIHYQQSTSVVEANGKTKQGILIRLNIVCPAGSYNVNIEPAKDDVMFADEEQVISHFERFLLSVYPATNNHPAQRRTAAGLGTPPSSSCVPQETAKLTKNLAQGWAVDMSGAVADASDDDDNGDEGHGQMPASDRPTNEDHREDSESPSRSINPWSIAALAASRRPELPLTGSLTSREQRARPLSRSSSIDMSDISSGSERGPCGKTLLSIHRRSHVSVEGAPNRPAVGVPRGPYQRPLPATSASAARKPRAAGFRGRGSSEGQWENSRSLPTRNRPYQHQAMRPELGQTRLVFSNEGVQRQGESEDHRYGHPSGSFHLRPPVPPRAERYSDLESSKERRIHHETTKGHARRPTREEFALRVVPDSPPHRPSHVDDTLEAVVLPVGVQSEESLESSLPTGDRRVYLIKRQRSIARNPAKKRRLRTDLLPLEVIPRGAETQSLALTIKVDTSRLSAKLLSEEILADGDLVSYGLKSGLGGGQLAPLERKISALLSQLGIEGVCLELKPIGRLREQPSPKCT